ncbi:unnamed protein product, partial [Chrysoparadoxa australica]
TERAAASCAGALLTAFVVTPLDVVKTRLQAGVGNAVGAQATGATLLQVSGDGRSFSLIQPRTLHNTSTSLDSPNPRQDAASNLYRPLITPALFHPNHLSRNGTGSITSGSTTRGLVRIWQTEGLSGLYSGLAPTLLMAVPQTVLYFSCYDWLRGELGSRGAGSVTAPLAAGVMARTVAASVIAPLELIRTQVIETLASYLIISFLFFFHPPISLSVLSISVLLTQHTGFRGLWRGLGPTLWRDVPFSALYWVGLESCKSCIQARQGRVGVKGAGLSETMTTFVSGAAAGCVATVLTHPFDVVKTYRQVRLHPPQLANRHHPDCTANPPELLCLIIRSIFPLLEGLSGLYTGLGARVVKVAPACAIMISSYEWGKHFLAQRTQLAAHHAQQAHG